MPFFYVLISCDFSPSSLLMWCITLIDFSTLSQSHILRTIPNCLSYIILFMYCWIQFISLSENFWVYVYERYWFAISFTCNVVVWFCIKVTLASWDDLESIPFPLSSKGDWRELINFSLYMVGSRPAFLLLLTTWAFDALLLLPSANCFQLCWWDGRLLLQMWTPLCSLWRSLLRKTRFPLQQMAPSLGR